MNHAADDARRWQASVSSEGGQPQDPSPIPNEKQRPPELVPLSQSLPGQWFRQWLEASAQSVLENDPAGLQEPCAEAKNIVSQIGVAGNAWQVYRCQEQQSCQCVVLVTPESRSLTRWEHGQTRVLERIAMGVPLSEVLSVLVEEVEKQVPHTHAAVLILDERRQRFRRGAAPSLPDSVGKLLDGLQAASGFGCCGTAAATGERVVVPDVRSHPSWASLPPQMHKLGIHGSWSEPVYSSTGTLLGTLTLFARKPDVVERINRHWVATAAHLAGIAIERDRSAKELIRAKEEAEASSRAKAQFLANMSHEIRTPMTAILGFAELLREQVTDARQQELTEIIYRNANYLLKIINDILDLSKIEAGKIQLDVQDVSPFEVLEDVKSMMRRPAEEKGLELSLEYRSPLPKSIRTDPFRLRQILVNLLGNAVKFTHQGSVHMVAELLGASGSEPLLAVDVIDTGVGIPQEKLNSIFQPFVQADSSTTRRFGGTGLGLSISLHLAHLLGGTITVESTPGRGSRFRLTVPTGPVDPRNLVQPRPAYRQHSGQSASSEANPVQALSLQGHVLLVEDGPDNRRLIAHILTKYGMEITTATHGQEALELFQMHWSRAEAPPFDLVLLDMQMPVMDGYTTVAELRRRGWTGPVIALTAFAMAQDRQKCLEAGCDEYLTKPINKTKLLQTLARFLKQATAQ